jgi:hypothetical protein
MPFFAEHCRKSQKIVIITSTPWADPTYDRKLQRQRCKNSQRQEKPSAICKQKYFILHAMKNAQAYILLTTPLAL